MFPISNDLPTEQCHRQHTNTVDKAETTHRLQTSAEAGKILSSKQNLISFDKKINNSK